MISDALKCNRTLTNLDLSSDEMKEMNTKNKEGEKIKHWTGNGITAYGIKVLSDVLKKNSTLIALGLGGGEWANEQKSM